MCAKPSGRPLTRLTSLQVQTLAVLGAHKCPAIRRSIQIRVVEDDRCCGAERSFVAFLFIEPTCLAPRRARLEQRSLQGHGCRTRASSKHSAIASTEDRHLTSHKRDKCRSGGANASQPAERTKGFRGSSSTSPLILLAKRTPSRTSNRSVSESASGILFLFS